MVPISTVISEVQSGINDIAATRINRAEYIDLTNRLAIKVAQETEIYINRYSFVPNPSSAPVPGVFSVKLPYTQVGTTNIDFAPYRIIRVTRGNVNGSGLWECNEYSSQAIARTVSGNSSFEINNTQLGISDYATQFMDSTNSLDNSISLIFGQSFATDEAVTIDFVSNRPWGNTNTTSANVNPLTRWMPNNTNPQMIPDAMYEVYREGLMYLVCDRLYMTGDESFAQRSAVMRQRYMEALKEARAYSKKLKTTQGGLKMQPLNWLEE